MIDRSASELLQALNKGETTSEAITKGFLQTIRDRDPRVKAFLHGNEEDALQQARTVGAKRKRGEPLGALAGIPIAIKDVLCIKGQPTTCGSKILQNFKPPYDATVITRLREADAILLGKTNMDEFAMGSSTENSAYQTTRNPWDLERIPGASSGGPAPAPAAPPTPLPLAHAAVGSS